MAESNREIMLNEVTKTSTYFSSIVELIPSKYYFPESGTRSGPDNLDEAIVGKIPKEKKKLLAKKAKLHKFDPNRHKSIQEIQKEIEEKDSTDNNGIEKLGDNMIKPLDITKVGSLPLDELRKKLHDKIELLRGKRKLNDGVSSANNAKKSRKDNSSKKKKKENNEAKKSSITKFNVQNERKITKVLNDKGDVVFSKFDFADETSKRKKKAKNSDLQALLSKAEKRKEKLEKLEEESKEKAKELKSKIKWDKALKHAEGVKVKDDPALLLKTMKKKKKIKEASKRKWEERVNTQKKLQEEKQRLRKQHLAERKEKKGVKGGKNKKQTKKGKKHKPGF